MSRINMARVILGGFVAGIVLNISETILNTVVLGEALQTSLASLNRPPIGGGAIAVFVVLMFVLGIAMIWLYAAIRPRYGAGPKTALCAGAAVWFFAYLFPSIGNVAMGLFPAKLIAFGTVWGLVELLVAAVIGAWFYREEPTRAASM